MRNILIITMLIVSVFSLATPSESTKLRQNGMNVPSVSYNILGTVYLSQDEIKLPLSISVVAPSEKVLSVSGPSAPNISFTQANGKLTVTFTKKDEIFDLYKPGKYHVEVYTNPNRYYAIKLIVS